VTAEFLPIFLAAVAAVSGAIVTWMVSRRRNSGNINTSEAETLWSEGQEMRKELRGEVLTLRKELAALHLEAAGLRQDMLELRAETERLRDENEDLRMENSQLKGTR
jgi:sensor domain CHASE-containing protein